MPKLVEFRTNRFMEHRLTADPTHNPRSVDPRDYQAVPRPLAAMAKSFADGTKIAPHAHQRDQFLYAVDGIMRVRTRDEAWIVPPDRAVYIPALTEHAISVRGDLEMRTLYLAPHATTGLPAMPTVFEVSELLRNLIVALNSEPVLYDEAGRGGALATLILSEITSARRLALGVAMPRDARLERLCAALIADPSSRLTIEGWSEMAGASARTLARLFEHETGMSFGAWRRKVRLHNAIEEIVAGQPIARVAARSGYRSASAFSAAFRRSMGVAPSALRDARADYAHVVARARALPDHSSTP
jgi:AraC-like DNA-binding protein/mannose-6-phosphate isomerase-like protein (cupin superfamily)